MILVYRTRRDCSPQQTGLRRSEQAGARGGGHAIIKEKGQSIVSSFALPMPHSGFLLPQPLSCVFSCKAPASTYWRRALLQNLFLFSVCVSVCVCVCVCVLHYVKCVTTKMAAVSHVFVRKTTRNHQARGTDSASFYPSLPPHPLDSSGATF